jgi:hypothetical protein
MLSYTGNTDMGHYDINTFKEPFKPFYFTLVISERKRLIKCFHARICTAFAYIIFSFRFI